MTGVKLIAKERQHQIDKHGFTGAHHVHHPEWYGKGQLLYAAELLISKEPVEPRQYPENWNHDWFTDLLCRHIDERSIMAGALIAAELDRRNELSKRNDTEDRN